MFKSIIVRIGLLGAMIYLIVTMSSLQMELTRKQQELSQITSQNEKLELQNQELRNLVENGTVEDVFSQPKSAAAKKLIFRKAGADMGSMGDRMIRIVFEGNASTDPVIASLVMECHIAVNIMYADTRDVNGKAFGQMILQLPEDKLQQEKAIYYLQSKGMRVEEVSSSAS